MGAPTTAAEQHRLSHLNYLEFGRELARWSGAAGAVAEVDGVVLFGSGTDFPITCNGAARLDDSVDAIHVVDVAEAWFAARGTGYSIIATELDGRDDDLIAAALDRRLLELVGSPAMVCPAPLEAAVIPDGIDLRWVGVDAPAADFVAICDAAYQTLGMPPAVVEGIVQVPDRLAEPHLHTAVLYEGDQALACAQVLLSHGVAGVYYVGTVAAARGRGLAELVTRVVTNLGFERGASLVTLQASAMGEPIYRRMGYEERYRYRLLTRIPRQP